MELKEQEEATSSGGSHATQSEQDAQPSNGGQGSHQQSEQDAQPSNGGQGSHQGENATQGNQPEQGSSVHGDVIRPRHVSFISDENGEEVGQPGDPKHVGFSDSEFSTEETGESSAKTDKDGEEEEVEEVEAKQGKSEVKMDMYDLYYGLHPGMPDFPLQLVFHLMDSQRFRSSPQATRWLRIGKTVGGVMSVAVIIYYFAFVDYHVRVHPRPPHLDVHYWNWQGCGVFPVTNDSIIRQQEEGSGNYYAYRLNCGFKLFLNLTNPNSQLDLFYDAIEVIVLYASRPICYDKIDHMFHPSSSTIRPFFYLFTVGLPVPLNIGYELGPKLERGMFYEIEETIVFNVEILSRFTMKATHIVKSLACWIRWRCEFTISTLSGRDTAKCWQLEGNSRPSHSGLKLYRTEAWPSTYTSLSFPMPMIPEYYDPVYNYARR